MPGGSFVSCPAGSRLEAPAAAGGNVHSGHAGTPRACGRRDMTYEIRDGWVIGQLPGPDDSQVRVKHFPQGPYERRRRRNPHLCLHTTQTNGYVEHLRFPSEFQVGENVIGQHRPLWGRKQGD